MMKHPMDIKGSKMSFIAAKMFLEKQNDNLEFKKKNCFPKISSICSTTKRIIMFSIQVIIWIYVLITDILVIHNFKNISINVPFNNNTSRSYEEVSALVDLYFNVMAFGVIFYAGYIIVTSIQRLCGKISTSELTKNLARYSKMSKYYDAIQKFTLHNKHLFYLLYSSELN